MTPPTLDGAALLRVLPARHGALRAARHDVERWLSAQLADDDLRSDLMLAVSELMTNAVHAAPPGSPVAVRLERTDHGLTGAVTNVGAPFVLPERRGFPDASSVSGRGLEVVRSVADEVAAEPAGPGRVMVSFRRSLER